MSECQDCNKKEATTIIYDKDKGIWIKVCDDCIDSDTDLVCPYDLKEVV